MKEDKNKVGRPKLADSKLKKNSIIMIEIAVIGIISLIIGGMLSLTNVNSNKLKGEVALGSVPIKSSDGTVDISIYSQKYLKEFSNVKKLDVMVEQDEYNSDTIDFSHNKNLEELEITDPPKTIILSKNKKLKKLVINQSTVSGALTPSKLQNLDLNNNTNLEYLSLMNQLKLKKISLKNNKKLKEIYIYNIKSDKIEIINLPNIEDILHLSNFKVNSMTISGNDKLEILSVADSDSNNYCKKINITNNKNLKEIEIEGIKNLSSINIKSPNLEKLNIYDTNVNSFDLSKFRNLNYIRFHNNPKIKKLDLTNNKKLTYVDIENNKSLEKIYFDKETKLDKLNLARNNIKTISGFPIVYKYVNLYGNKNLSTVSENIFYKHLSKLVLCGTNIKSLNLNEITPSSGIGGISSNFNINYDETVRLMLGEKKKALNIIPSVYLTFWNVPDMLERSNDKAYGKNNINNGYYNNGYWVGTKTGNRSFTIDHGFSEDEKKYVCKLEIKVFDLSSNKYIINKDKKFIYVENDDDKKVLNNISVSENGSKKIKNGYFYVMDGKVVVQKYKIVRISSSKYNIKSNNTGGYIFTKGIKFNVRNIKAENAKLFVENNELSVKYENMVLRKYNILNICKVSLDNNLNYNINCYEDNVKIKKVSLISDGDTIDLDKNMSGKLSVYESSYPRNVVVSVRYIYKGKEKRELSNVVLVPKASNFMHDSEKTYCKTYITKVDTNNATYAVRCDARAKPAMIELYKNGTKVAILDDKFDKHYNYIANNLMVNYSKYNLSKNDNCVIRIKYRFNFSSNHKMDYYDTSFKPGTTKTEVIPTINSDNTQKCKINILEAKNKTIKYSLKCEKNASPMVLRLTRKSQEKPYSLVSSSMKISNETKYSNGKKFKHIQTHRNYFDNQAKADGLSSYGLQEVGNMLNINSGQYRLLLYYRIKDNSNKVIDTYVRTESKEVNVR